MDNEIEERKRKSNEAEQKFKEWLDKHNIPYMYIQQDTGTFSSVFKKYSSGSLISDLFL